TLVLHGTADTLIRPDAGRHTAQCIRDAEYHEIEGWGHDMPLGAIPVVQGFIKPFVEKVERTRKAAKQAAESADLFDLAFLEHDVFAQHGVILLDGELLRHRARVLLGDLKEGGAAFAVETDFG